MDNFYNIVVVQKTYNENSLADCIWPIYNELRDIAEQEKTLKSVTAHQIRPAVSSALIPTNR